jgi:hypothetical protein
VPDFYKVSTSIAREFLGEIFASRLGRKIRFEVAQIEDAAAVGNFLRNEFFKIGPMARTLREFCCT